MPSIMPPCYVALCWYNQRTLHLNWCGCGTWKNLSQTIDRYLNAICKLKLQEQHLDGEYTHVGEDMFQNVSLKTLINQHSELLYMYVGYILPIDQ